MTCSFYNFRQQNLSSFMKQLSTWAFNVSKVEQLETIRHVERLNSGFVSIWIKEYQMKSINKPVCKCCRIQFMICYAFQLSRLVIIYSWFKCVYLNIGYGNYSLLIHSVKCFCVLMFNHSFVNMIAFSIPAFAMKHLTFVFRNSLYSIVHMLYCWIVYMWVCVCSFELCVCLSIAVL